jgi:hypothetical protein
MQPELNFNAPSSGGYELWLRQRQSLIAHLTDQLGFPIGREVEVWLQGGIRLRGTLTVREESIHWSNENKAVGVELAIGQVYFPISQIESCVRLD